MVYIPYYIFKKARERREAQAKETQSDENKIENKCVFSFNCSSEEHEYGCPKCDIRKSLAKIFERKKSS